MLEVVLIMYDWGCVLLSKVMGCEICEKIKSLYKQESLEVLAQDQRIFVLNFQKI